MATGGCFCGKVRYETGNNFSDETLCHCSICRGTTGAPAVAWITVPAEAFRFTRGQPTAYPSSETGVRHFCGNCGTQLTFKRGDLPDEIDLTSCSLDDPASAPPKDHTFVRSRVPWLQTGDELPEYLGAVTEVARGGRASRAGLRRAR